MNGTRPARAVLFGVCLALLVLAGCGKKGPPVPPQAPQPPRAVKLKILSDGPAIVLQWQVDPAGVRHVRSFQILEAASPQGAEKCRGCPLVFQRIGVVERGSGKNGKYSFRTRVRPGFRYTFKIRSMGRSAGLYSDSVTITYAGGEN